MLRCKEVRELLDEYVDGMLEDQQQTKVKTHLASCAECSASLEELSSMLQMMGDLDEQELPNGFHGRLHERLKAEVPPVHLSSHRGKAPASWYKWCAAAAAAVVLLLSLKLLGPASPLDLRVGKDNGQMEMQSAANGEEDAVQIAGTLAEEKADEAEADRSEEPSMDPATPLRETEFIRTNAVNLYVQDVCILPQTLYILASQNEINVVEILEDGITVDVDGMSQRAILYDELNLLGRVDEAGTADPPDERITIRILFEE